MKSRMLANSILLGIAASLSGCLALSALFGAGSFLLNGPAQYIGTVYAVGEYTYEYAANDKTPVTVLGEKLDKLGEWLNPEGPQIPESRVLLARSDVQGTTVIPGNPQSALPQTMATTATKPQFLTPARETRALSEPLYAKRPPRPLLAMKKQAKPKAMPLSPPVSPTISRPNPAPVSVTMHAAASAPPRSLRQLQRMEQAFARADVAQYAKRDPGGLRISVGSDTRGISGSWQIRHRVSRPDLS